MRNYQNYLIIALIGALLFIPFLGSVHLFDWDEVNFAECSREMVVSGNYSRVQVDFKPFWEKPPLFFWLQASAMHVFGINEFAARFPNAIIGIITLLVLFNIGKKIYDETFAIIWVLAYIGSFLPHFYFKAGIIDPLFNLFIFLTIYQFACLTLSKDAKARRKHSILAGFLIGIAILAKGPVAVFILGLCVLVYWIMSRKLNTFRFPEFFLFTIFTLLVSSLWYLPETIQNGTWFIKTFIDYQYGLAIRPGETGHEQPFWYHPVVLLLGCFPASIFFLKAFSKATNENDEQKNIKRWFKIFFWVALIVFSLIRAKIVHYSSLCYYPITFLAADYIYRVYKNETAYSNWLNYFFGLIGVIISTILLIFPFVYLFKDQITPYVDDTFAVANINAEVNWTGFESIAGIIFLGGLVVGLYFAFKKDILKSAISFFIGTCIALQLTFYLTIPKVEAHIQKEMIDFLKSVADEDAYVASLGYRSYAQYFYGTVDEDSDLRRDDMNWLITGDIDKPVYFVTRVDRIEKEDADNIDIKGYGPISKKVVRKIGGKNGFVFLKRDK